MKISWILIFACLGLVGWGCKDTQDVLPHTNDTEISTFYFIRHAEKDRTDPEAIDPELNQRGLGRAMHWAEILNQVQLDAVYSTDFERTNMTAAPVSVKQDITVQYYDPDQLDIDQFKQENRGRNVLVVGHSNSTPALVNKFLGEEKYSAMDDYDNGSLFIVQEVGGQMTDIRLVFNCNCPE